ncbi:Mitochondrial import inner membrane translocase subunit TIM16 [Hypsizygus marmoreus]|uniref:Mitochondrial import inner membrane translocase subunit TIM16 n=1 Tax=Hypsizygus marmoreus TaxID=39966 RepID=A0A369J883_HYPMA|nr:Mitochondrial import inner membrane translocase subunit TIM16 [Hypsizygus marmoreus]
MSSPKAIVQILITGSKILGKAFFEAGRQAVKNAKQSPQGALGSDVAGVGHAKSGSMTDQMTRLHRMTLDEANLILNVKREDSLEKALKNYEHLFKANAFAPPPPDKPIRGRHVHPIHSHYLQSKVVRARERIEAEFKAAEAPAAAEAGAPGAGTPGSTHAPPPPPPPPPHEMPNGGGKS